jgi:hypothetical protein
MMKYSLHDNGDGTGNITVIADGEMYSAISEHPCYKEIVAAALDGDPAVVEMFDVGRAINTKFQQLSERVSVKDEKVYLDGDEVSNSVTEAILRFMNEGHEDWLPMVQFFEKLQSNPSKHSRAQLHAWLANYTDFTITKHGNILAYKGVTEDFMSRRSGHAIVDGEDMHGYIPNRLGSVVEMPRSEVYHDPSSGCASGLHVACYRFADGWGPVCLSVEVNPRDVVSVPNHDAEKMRVCRYKVRGVVESESSSVLADDDDSKDFSI